jgi:hypothetical protein
LLGNVPVNTSTKPELSLDYFGKRAPTATATHAAAKVLMVGLQQWKRVLYVVRAEML